MLKSDLRGNISLMTGVNAKIRNKSSHSHRAKEKIETKTEAKTPFCMKRTCWIQNNSANNELRVIIVCELPEYTLWKLSAFIKEISSRGDNITLEAEVKRSLPNLAKIRKTKEGMNLDQVFDSLLHGTRKWSLPHVSWVVRPTLFLVTTFKSNRHCPTII